jgi:hypothetical protein
MGEEIINKVAQSGLVTFDLEEIYPQGERALIDIRDQLFHGLILKEKDFRAYIAANDWSIYKDKHVAVMCSNDAIVPVWAYMLLSVALKDHAKTVVFGDAEQLESVLYHDVLNNIDWEQYRDARVVIKGCSNKPVPRAAYVEAASKLTPLVKSVMYGEPCSTVPLYKKPKA